jgi:WXG100 family type VII secretion target
MVAAVADDLVVEHSLLAQAASTVDEVTAELQSARKRLDSEAKELLGAGWTGPAASDFGAGMTSWDAGVADVLAALRTMGTEIAQADQAYRQRDQLSRAALNRIHTPSQAGDDA